MKISMRCWRQIAFCVLLLAAALQSYAAMDLVRVTADRVNLRAKPLLDVEVVGQVGEGERLSVKSVQGGWVEVLPPQDVVLWVHQEFVSGSIVQADKLNVRGGPGINFSVVGTVSKGQSLNVVERFGEWLKIRPPESASLWVSRDFVQWDNAAEHMGLTTKQAPGRSPQRIQRKQTSVVPMPPPEEHRPAVAVPVKPATQSAQLKVPPRPSREFRIPSNWDLIPLEGQGKRVERRGILRGVPFGFTKPSKYRLVDEEGGSRATLCYVLGDPAQLRTWAGEAMVIRGRQYWIHGSDYPVLVVEQALSQESSLAQ